MKMFIFKNHGLKQAHKRHYKKVVQLFCEIVFLMQILIFFIIQREKHKKNILKLEEHHRASAKQAYKRVGETQNIATDK